MFRTALVCLCVLGASFTLAGRAHAGAYGTPWDSDVCNDIFARDFLDDPNTTNLHNASMKDCLKLCKQATAECRGYAKKTASCFNSFNGDEQSYGKSNCKTIFSGDPNSLKSCKASADANFAEEKAGIKSDLEEALSDCDNWGDTCATGCGDL